jgi:hypothetical protein
MATVSSRIGWGKSSAGCLALAAFNLLLAVLLYLNDYRGVSMMLVGVAVLSAYFAFVHPHRVLELDEDDDPRRKVGDLVDDEPE